MGVGVDQYVPKSGVFWTKKFSCQKNFECNNWLLFLVSLPSFWVMADEVWTYTPRVRVDGKIQRSVVVSLSGRVYQARDFSAWAWQDCRGCVCAMCALLRRSTYSKHRQYITCSRFLSVFPEKSIGWGAIQHIPKYELEEDVLGERRMKHHDSSVLWHRIWILVSLRSFWVIVDGVWTFIARVVINTVRCFRDYQARHYEARDFSVRALAGLWWLHVGHVCPSPKFHLLKASSIHHMFTILRCFFRKKYRVVCDPTYTKI